MGNSFTRNSQFAFSYGSDRLAYVGGKFSHVTAIGNAGIELR